MPQQPILPTVDWERVFESGKKYESWLASGESSQNRARMEASRQGLKLEPDVVEFLNALEQPVHVVAIAEDWCGDVVRHVAVLQRLADASGPNLKVRFVTRDQHPDVFVRFLTNGGEAVPKFIFLNDKFVECGNWGPMPEECRERIARGKACDDLAAARMKVSALYEADSDLRVVISELVHLIDIASCSEP